jgi:hypothetical protein
MIILPAKRDSHFCRGPWLELSLIIERTIAMPAATALDGLNPNVVRSNLEP